VTATFEPLRHAGLRLDSGVPTGGSVVGTHYDPMLAKLIAYAPTRAAAARRLAAALAGARIHGLTTNRDLLVRVLRSQSFLDGEVDTAFLARHAELVTAGPDESRVRLSAIAAALAAAAGNRASAKVLAGLPSGWRNLPSAPRRARFTVGSAYTMGSDVLEVAYRGTRVGIEVDGLASGSVIEAASDRVVLEADGVRRTFRVASYGARVEVDSPLGAVTLFAVPLLPGPEPAGENVPGSLLAPMPGSVVRIAVRVGERVSAGQPLLWLEAMKMQHQIVAPLAGIVGALPVSAGSQVEVGAVLVVIEPVNTVEESG
jgi:propionyl-CoA carboxylase alpha chain